MKLYDALRCPYCARVRIALAEKALPYEAVPIDLSNRPEWLYELNPLGKVPVLDDSGFILPESEDSSLVEDVEDVEEEEQFDDLPPEEA